MQVRTSSDLAQVSLDFKSFKVNMQKTLLELNSLPNFIHHRVDNLQKYPTKNCILIHEIIEQTSEDIVKTVLDCVRQDLKVTDNGHSDLDNHHRHGKCQNGKKLRPLIVKFCSY